ncbi:MAG: hypothetical protein M1829_000637 [Trizodia sp. TS-e1964]|nr:MAG: hypothetical protein M1829_000637 [Trizodia sp. TS-e1964]
MHPVAISIVLVTLFSSALSAPQPAPSSEDSQSSGTAGYQPYVPEYNNDDTEKCRQCMARIYSQELKQNLEFNYAQTWAFCDNTILIQTQGACPSIDYTFDVTSPVTVEPPEGMSPSVAVKYNDVDIESCRKCMAKVYNQEVNQKLQFDYVKTLKFCDGSFSSKNKDACPAIPYKFDVTTSVTVSNPMGRPLTRVLDNTLSKHF